MKRKSHFKIICLMMAFLMFSGGLLGCSPAESVMYMHALQMGRVDSKEKGLEAALRQSGFDDVYIERAKAVIPEEPVTIKVYSQVNTYGGGQQEGWFAQLMLELFNVVIDYNYSEYDNFFCQYMIRNNDLGDIVIWNNSSVYYKMAVQLGLLREWEQDGLLKDYGPIIAENMQASLELNRSISGGNIYGFMDNVAYESGEIGEISIVPSVRWDLYETLNYPRVASLEDYLSVMARMQAICPAADNGAKTYGISFYKDKSGGLLDVVSDTIECFFGMEQFGLGFYDVEEGKFVSLFSEDSKYQRVLSFYNVAYRNGLLDSRSTVQSRSECMLRYENGEFLSSIYPELTSSYNTVEHSADGKMILPLAALNQKITVEALNENGSGNIWTISANSPYPELCMLIFNWMCTPEGRLTMEYGPKGIGWDYDSAGDTYILEYGYEAFCDNDFDMGDTGVYSGTWLEGRPHFGTYSWAKDTINPHSNGETYNALTWKNVAELEAYPIEQKWQEYTGFSSTKDYLCSFSTAVSKANAYTFEAIPTSLSSQYNTISELIYDYSVNAVMADSDERFRIIIAELKSKMKDAGYVEIVTYLQECAQKRRETELDK